MIRVVLVVVAVCLSFELSGLAASLGDAACSTDECPADASGGECAPNCHLCTCCSLPRVAPTELSTGQPLPRATRTNLLGMAAMPTAPEPRDILHVPKPALV